MKFINLASSSAGNCYYIELDRKGLPPVKLMLEAGLSYQEIVKKATRENIDLTILNAVLITHGHGDHCKGAKDLLRRNHQIYANSDVIGRINGKESNIFIKNEVRLIAADTKVMPIEVQHDAPDSLGFVIKTSEECILFVNDCKFFEVNLENIAFDYVFIESNYDGQVLHFAYEEAKKQNDISNIKRYERLFNSHMSLSHCIKHLQHLNLIKCKAIFLMHLSDRHANENKFKNEVKKITKVNCFVCKKNGGIL